MTTIVIEGRIDPKDLASIIFLYADRGIVFDTKSEALRQLVHDFALTLRQLGAKKFETDEEAVHYLISTGMALKDRQISKKSLGEAVTNIKAHISDPAPPIDLSPDEVKNIFGNLLTTPSKT